MNEVILIGHLGSKPKLKYTRSSTAVLNLRMATNRRVKDGNEWKDATDWHNVVVWDKRAEGLAKVVDKGALIAVRGELRTNSWEKNGEKRYSTEIHAHYVELLGSNRKEQGQQRGGGSPFDRGMNAA